MNRLFYRPIRKNKCVLRLLKCRANGDIIYKVTLIALLIFSVSCAYPFVKKMAARDIYPPDSPQIKQKDEKFIELLFNEEIEKVENLKISPGTIAKMRQDRQEVSLEMAEGLSAGQRYVLSGKVSDKAGNVLDFLAPFYGANDNVAHLLLSELNPKGSKKSNNPEIIELAVLSAGNTAGVTLYLGSGAENYKKRFIFPTLQVEKGDYLILHSRWDEQLAKDIVKVNETVDKNAAQARLTSSQAWDLWLEDEDAQLWEGVSSSAGALSLYTSPEVSSQPMDALIYRNSPQEKYDGWGNKQLQIWAEELQAIGFWKFNSTPLKASEAILMATSTAKRSLNRYLLDDGNFQDTNTARDWFIAENITAGTSYAVSDDSSGSDDTTDANTDDADSVANNDDADSVEDASSSDVRLLFSEFNPKGSGNNPEIIEFVALSSGNLQGMTLYYGVDAQHYDKRFIFPELQVKEGDYLIVHTRWDEAKPKDSVKANEVADKGEAQARLSNDQAWDLWAESTAGELWNGLSSTSGVLSLYNSAKSTAQLLDALIYRDSVKKSYNGWGSKKLEGWAQKLKSLGGWIFDEAGEPSANQALLVKNSSGTRSLNRRSTTDNILQDTNGAQDWFIGANRTISAGEPNTAKEYESNS